jgi:hypothetical protein
MATASHRPRQQVPEAPTPSASFCRFASGAATRAPRRHAAAETVSPSSHCLGKSSSCALFACLVEARREKAITRFGESKAPTTSAADCGGRSARGPPLLGRELVRIFVSTTDRRHTDLTQKSEHQGDPSFGRVARRTSSSSTMPRSCSLDRIEPFYQGTPHPRAFSFGDSPAYPYPGRSTR